MTHSQSSSFVTHSLPVNYDVIAPDGSEIRLLVRTGRCSMVHCTLQPGSVTRAVRHKTVEEVWYFISGEGEIWRRLGDQEEVVKVKGGIGVSIPLGTIFQFKCNSIDPLCFVVVTFPPWPGEGEAEVVEGYWAPR